MRTKAIILIVFAGLTACTGTKVPQDEVPETLESNTQGKGQHLEITMARGEGHNHPLMAIWVESQEGAFIQTLYVAESIGRGIFRHGDASEGFWQPGEIQRPAALPRWSHQRAINEAEGPSLPTPTNPVPDAYTGPTPARSFTLGTRLNEKATGRITIWFEINQTWDWNDYWTNNKYPDNAEYKSSCQPALIYSTTIDFDNPKERYLMEIKGRSHHSGDTGEIFTDLETMSTALHIAEEISLYIVN